MSVFAVCLKNATFPSASRMKWFLILSLLSIVRISVSQACWYSRMDTKHTMCIFKPKMCPGRMMIKSGGLSCSEKDEILKIHNRLRQKLAQGRITGQPVALNMQTMIWSDELAMVAQRWADQCKIGHDKSRNIGRFIVGQNVAATWTYDYDEGDFSEFKNQIQDWFDEVFNQGFSRNNIDPFAYSKPAGHYTQIAWAETYMVGCGFSYYYDKGTGYTKLYVCNYAPGGNIIRGSMYKAGYSGQQRCSQFGLRQSSLMPGLCDREDENYQSECSKSKNEFISDVSNEEISDSSSETKMEPSFPFFAPHVPLDLDNKMHPPPPSSLEPPNSYTPQFEQFPSSSSPFDFQPSSKHPFHHFIQAHLKRKNYQSPFKGLNSLLKPWNLFNTFTG